MSKETSHIFPAFLGLAAAMVAAQPDSLSVLQFSKFAGCGHGASVDASFRVLPTVARQRGWKLVQTKDAAYFTDANLSAFDVIFFDNTCGEIVFTNESQRLALQKYMRAGGGYVGTHAASYTEYRWAWYGSLVGSVNSGHPDPDTATMTVEIRNHPSTLGMPARWNPGNNEWFTHNPHPRTKKNLHILMTVPAGHTFAGQLWREEIVVSWCHVFEGARSLYTDFGHFPTAFTDPAILTHIVGALEWAGGRAPGNGTCGEPAIGIQSGRGNRSRNFPERFFSASGGTGGVEVRTLENSNYRLELVDPNGRPIASEKVAGAGRIALPVRKPGVYLLRVRVEGRTFVRSLAVRE